MASVPYGSYYYGRSRYNNPGYHFAEAAVVASASASAVPTLRYNIVDAGTMAAQSNVVAVGNHKFQTSTAFTQSSTTISVGTRIKIGIITPSFITEISDVLTFGQLVGQTESDIHPTSSLTVTGQQIDIGELTISAVAQTNVIGQQIDLGASNINVTSGATTIGTQIDLGVVNPISVAQVVSVGTQIDLGASASCRPVSDVLTTNPIFSKKTINITHAQKFLADGTQGNIEFKKNIINEIKQFDSSNVGNTLALSKVPDGIYNNSVTNISARIDSNSRSYLQVSGASQVFTSGGTATRERRTIYKYSGDSAGQAPTYTGSAWPYVYYATNPIIDDGITATVGAITVGGYSVMTIDGFPAYQYSEETSNESASGVGGSWVAFQADGSSQTNTAASFISNSQIYTTGIVTTGTVGSNRQITFTPNNSTPTLYYFSLENASQGATGLMTILEGVESTYLVSESSDISAISGLSSSAIRKYFLESEFTQASSVITSGELKWEQQSAPPTVWTEQKIAQTP